MKIVSNRNLENSSKIEIHGSHESFTNVFIKGKILQRNYNHSDGSFPYFNLCLLFSHLKNAQDFLKFWRCKNFVPNGTKMSHSSQFWRHKCSTFVARHLRHSYALSIFYTFILFWSEFLSYTSIITLIIHCLIK